MFVSVGSLGTSRNCVILTMRPPAVPSKLIKATTPPHPSQLSRKGDRFSTQPKIMTATWKKALTK